MASFALPFPRDIAPTQLNDYMDYSTLRKVLLPLLLLCALVARAESPDSYSLTGRIAAKDQAELSFAQISLRNTAYRCTADNEGRYSLAAPAGKYIMVVKALGYRPAYVDVTIKADADNRRDVVLTPLSSDLGEALVTTTGVGRVRRSAYNATALSTEPLKNSTKTLGEALAKTPGVKLRESGGVGSDLSVMMDGFSGKHVKVFIDGVPQEGVGEAFGLNNIPVGFAERIEVYRGVVPVGFGTDALGGVVNIVTARPRAGWNVDASYSYGSFNTHRSNVSFSHTLRNGFTYRLTAFQNYSDNDYDVYAPVRDFATGSINRRQLHKVRRFHDTYHNEAVSAKAGFVGVPWVDRLLLGFTYAHQYSDVQTGVRQEIVYGAKHRYGHSLMPSLEYRKRDLLVSGLDAALTLNYNRNSLTNVDTAMVEYNWYGESHPLNSPGEQSYLFSRADNDNWNATLTLNYTFRQAHTFTFSQVSNFFTRHNTSLLAKAEEEDAISKQSQKHISGLAYRWMPHKKWNVTAFGKLYRLRVAGPVAAEATGSSYVRQLRTQTNWGYGAAGTYFIARGLQVKLSYERALRLPTVDEMFGNEDLETGSLSIRPEKSHNLNVNLNFNRTFGPHGVYAEASFVYRNTDDYIQRNITDLSGGKTGASYTNYGKVLTRGFNLSARYSWSKWGSAGANITRMDVIDHMKYGIGSTKENYAYKEKMPNLPYFFTDMDVTFYWPDLLKKGNRLSLTYDNNFVREFSYYSSRFGTNKDDYMVPDQFSHNLTLAYSIGNGRINFSFECKNFTNERLYDNFSLQKAGRAFYGKIRINFGK